VEALPPLVFVRSWKTELGSTSPPAPRSLFIRESLVFHDIWHVFGVFLAVFDATGPMEILLVHF